MTPCVCECVVAARVVPAWEVAAAVVGTLVVCAVWTWILYLVLRR